MLPLRRLLACRKKIESNTSIILTPIEISGQLLQIVVMFNVAIEHRLDGTCPFVPICILVEKEISHERHESMQSAMPQLKGVQQKSQNC